MLGLSTNVRWSTSRLREREITFPGLDVVQPMQEEVRPSFCLLG